jgi:hypothetical protein
MQHRKRWRSGQEGAVVGHEGFVRNRRIRAIGAHSRLLAQSRLRSELGQGACLASARIYWYALLMNDAIAGSRKRGRPATGASSIHLRIEPDQLAALDHWIQAQGDPMSRPEAIRAILATALEL